MGVCMCNSRKEKPVASPRTVGISNIEKAGTAKRRQSALQLHPFKSKRPLIDCRSESSQNEELRGRWLRSPPPASETPMLLSTLQSHYMLRNLGEESLLSVISDMKELEISPRESVISQGNPGQYFFILASGAVEIVVDSIKRGTLSPHSCFGDQALIDDAPRSNSVVTVERCTFWVLERTAFKAAVQKVHESQREENQQFVENVSLFNSLTNAQKSDVLKFMNPQKWEPGQSIVREGETGTVLYIIKEGTVVCTRKGIEVRRMVTGEVFGEQALLHSQVRTATVIAVDTVKVLSISSENLEVCFGDSLEQVIYKNSILIALENSNTLNSLNDEQRQEISSKMSIRSLRAGEVLATESTEKGKHLWIVIKGKLHASRAFHPHQCLGDLEIASDTAEVFESHVRAVEDSVVAEISRKSLEETIGGHLQTLREFNCALQVLSTVPLFNRIPRRKLTQLARILQSINYSPGETIIQEGTEGDSFYIIKTGSAQVLKENVKLRSLGELSFFGERALLLSEKRSATIQAISDSVCWKISKEQFMGLIDQNIYKQLLKRIELQEDSIQMSQLVPIKALGSGMAGRVYLCGHENKKTLYALKSVSRELIESYDLYSGVRAERDILLQLDHPMIMKLVKTYKDDSRIYFLTEFVNGVDLFDALQAIGIVTEQDSKFYIGCLMLILEHLGDKNIVYRDLKPENVMVDSDGYPKLIDLGAAKIIGGRTYTTIGTPHYMAPEVIIGAGYDISVDWWSLGIMLFEFLYGDVPFGADQEEPAMVYKAVLANKLVFPIDSVNNRVNKFIECLLNIKPHLRANGSIKNLKKHVWLNGFNWDGLFSRVIKPSFTPKIKGYDCEIENGKLSRKSSKQFIDEVEGVSPNLKGLKEDQWEEF